MTHIAGPCIYGSMVAILLVRILRRAHKAVVVLLTGRVAIAICMTTLIDVAVPDCHAGKLLVFVLRFTMIAAANVYHWRICY
jgi:hypothetical protein